MDKGCRKVGGRAASVQRRNGGVTPLTASVSIRSYPCCTDDPWQAYFGLLSIRILRRIQMLWTIFVILLILWLIGVVSAHTFGGFIHLLLVLAIVVVLIRVISGRRPL